MQKLGLKLGLLSAGISLAFPCFAAASAPWAVGEQGQNVTPPQDGSQVQPQSVPDKKKSGDKKANTVTLSTVTVNDDAPKGYQAEDVQVGAFRDQTNLDTPATVNVMTRDLMDSQNDVTLFDVLQNSAGVTRTQTNGMSADNLMIRGVDVQNRSNYLLNGTLPVNNLISMPTEGLERIEVLKGASALYYGFTSPSGVVNMVTKRAMGQPNLSFQTTMDQYGEVIGAVDAGTKFGDHKQFGIRVNAAGGALGSFGIDRVDGNRSFESIAADWDATSRLHLSLDYQHAMQSVNEQAIIQVPAAVGGVITLPRLPAYSNNLSAGPWAVTKGNIQNTIGTAVYNISDNWTAEIDVGSAITNRTERNLGIFTLTNPATGAGKLSMSANQGERFVNDNYRAEVTGLIPMGSITNEVIFGVERNDRYQNTARGESLNKYVQNLYDPMQFAQLFPFNRPAIADKPQNARDDGVYVLDRIRFNDQWQVLLGARHTDYNDISQPSPTKETVYQASKTTPSAAVIYQLSDENSFYASYIQGLQEGNVAPSVGVVNPGEVFGPQVSTQKEIGFKTQALKGVTATVAYFDMKVPTPGYLVPSSTPPLSLFVQSGTSHYRGFEFTVAGRLSPQFSIVAGGMIMHASQLSAPNPLQVGKIPDSTPEHTLNAYLSYKPAWAPRLGLNVGAFYVGARPLGPLEQGWLPGYTTDTVGASYVIRLPEHHKLTFRLDVDNVTNKKYWTGGEGYIDPGTSRITSLVTRLDWL